MRTATGDGENFPRGSGGEHRLSPARRRAGDPARGQRLPRRRMEKITNPAAIVVTRFSVQRQVTPGFAPELSVTLAARSAQQTGLTSEVEQRVTGYNL